MLANVRNNRAHGEQVTRAIYLSGGPVSLRMVGFNLEVAEGGGVGGDASSSSSSSVPSDILASSSSFAAEPQPRSLGLMGPSSSTQSPSSPWRSVPGAEPSTPSSPETGQVDGRVRSSVIQAASKLLPRACYVSENERAIVFLRYRVFTRLVIVISRYLSRQQIQNIHSQCSSSQKISDPPRFVDELFFFLFYARRVR